MTKRRSFFVARALALLLLVPLSVFGAPSVGDPASSVEGVRGWGRLSDPPGSWTRAEADGWTVGCVVQDSSILRVDWWKPGSLADCQTEFTRALSRLGEGVAPVVMLSGWEACLVTIRGKLVVATILSVSSYREAYIMCRSDVLVGRLPK